MHIGSWIPHEFIDGRTKIYRTLIDDNALYGYKSNNRVSLSGVLVIMSKYFKWHWFFFGHNLKNSMSRIIFTFSLIRNNVLLSWGRLWLFHMKFDDWSGLSTGRSNEKAYRNYKWDSWSALVKLATCFHFLSAWFKRLNSRSYSVAPFVSLKVNST